MAKSRIDFLERISAYNSAVKLNEIVSLAPSEKEHNARARILRNGLAVVGFAIVEDFIKARTGEIVERIGQGATSFADLPYELKIAATHGVIDALLFQERNWDRKSSDYWSNYQYHAQSVASTGESAFRISHLAFAGSQSNISHSTIEDILRAFHIDNTWNAIGGVAVSVGVSSPAYKTIFENAALRRHKAAHRANADIESSDLADFGTQIIGLALSFDLLISTALRRILDSNKDYLKGDKKISARDVKVRSIELGGDNFWREKISINKTFRRDRDLNNLLTACRSRGLANNQAVVVKDARGIPNQWYTPNID